MAVGERFVLAADAPRTFPAWIRAQAARYGNKVALDIMGREKTYLELDADSDRVAAGLTELGLAAGDHCALMMKNSLENVDTWFGLTKAGVVELAVHHAARGNVLRHILFHGDAKVIILDEEFLPALADVIDDLPLLQHVVVNRETDGELNRERIPSRVMVHDHRALYSDLPPPNPRLERTDPLAILHTSGTTGPPKGAIICHESALHLTRHIVWLMDYTPEDRLYTAFPLFHNNAKYTSVTAAIECGGSVVIEQRFSVSRFWELCRKKRITAFNYMGALLMMLFKQDPKPTDRDHQVRIAFGAPCPVEIWEAFEERFGVRLVEVYGMTEAPIACENRLDDRRIGSAGKESMSYQVRIVDADDQPVPPNQPGEIVIRPKYPNIMFSGYYKRPEATVEAWRNLWFHTGDRGRMDEDGFLYFLDRTKDVIRRRGENISSWEVESVINTHPDVVEAAAYGVASELTEEEVMVAVVRRPGSDLRPEALLDFCQGKMSHFAVPRFVRFVDSLPKNHAQRVQKFSLREEGLTPDTWDREAAGYRVRRS
ncbi:MAG: ATP-dependent acyl-CoA ligase [Acidimicrobiia bacterium]|nr:MAG: ATP-dependent acyl-CoA ligase [Acidimicrobiia bacterium]